MESALAAVPTWQRADRALVAGRTVVVLDVLRWSTVVVTALANGAERIEAFATPDQARRRAAALGRDRVILGGERENRPINGFDVGNSPDEYTAARVRGKPVLTTTTNGTQALLAARGGAELLVGAFVNLDALVERLIHGCADGRGITLLCAGQADRETLEDTACAGALVDALLESRVVAERECDAAAMRARAIWTGHGRSAGAVLTAAPHATALRRDGYGADIAVAGSVGMVDLVGRLCADGAIRASESPEPNRRTSLGRPVH